MTTRDITTDIYTDSKSVMESIVQRFHRSHGGDLEELRAEASLLFLKAHATYKGSKGATWNTRLHGIIWWGLLDQARKIAKGKARFKYGSQCENHRHLHNTCDKQKFNLSLFLGELSPDASTVARLAITPPSDVVLDCRTSRKRDKARTMKESIVEYLSDMGWAADRIFHSFAEIREALQ